MMLTPRYLVPFHPKRVPHFFTDVLIIGGGLAGLRAALARRSRACRCWWSPRTACRVSNSAYAQGGIAGVLDPEDRFEDHVADTLAAGGSLCDRGGRRSGGPRGPAADRRTDRLGHAVRHGRRPPGPGPRGRPRPRPHRPRPGRRHRQGSHAGGDRAARPARPTSTSGRTPSRSIC